MKWLLAQLTRLFERPYLFMKDLYEYLDDHSWSLFSAGLSFYALISITPFVVLAVAIGGAVFGSTLAQHELHATVAAQAGPEVADLVTGLAQGAANLASLSLASIFGFVVLLWSSTSLMNQVRNALHVMWSIGPVKTPDDNFGRSVLKFLRYRVFAAFGTLVFGALFIALLGLRVALTVIESETADFLTLPFWFWDIADIVVAAGFSTVFVRVVYRVLADRSPRGKAPWIGAFVTAVLLVLGRTGVAVYLSVGAIASAYGAASALIVFLGWAYWSSLSFLFGARLTFVLARRWGKWPEPQTTPLSAAADAAPIALELPTAGPALAEHSARRGPHRTTPEAPPEE